MFSNRAETSLTKSLGQEIENLGQVFIVTPDFVPDVHWQHLDSTDVFLRIQQLSTSVPSLQ